MVYTSWSVTLYAFGAWQVQWDLKIFVFKLLPTEDNAVRDQNRRKTGLKQSSAFSMVCVIHIILLQLLEEIKLTWEMVYRKWVADTQYEVVALIAQLEVQWSTCGCVLEQNTKPQVAPNGQTLALL